MAEPRPYSPRLDDMHRRRAREMAEAQVPDSTILESLRADVYEVLEPGELRDLALAALQEMHPADAQELTDFRGRGRAWMQVAVYACAMGYALNARKERFRPEDHGEDVDPAELGYAKVAPVEASALQYMLRNVLALDANELTEDAQREAKRLIDGGAEAHQMAIMGLLHRCGVPQRMMEPIAQHFGMEMSEEVA